jgi:hypothetical protein
VTGDRPRSYDPVVGGGSRESYVEAFAAARAAADVAGMADAALALAATARFGVHAGRTPALLFGAYQAAGEQHPAMRARLAAALARTWVYGNDPGRAAPFAVEAVALAEQLGDDALVADALDAQLATVWGPDDLAERLRITTRLQDVAAHLDEPHARLQAHLWRLTTALENIDIVGAQRQLAALDVLADDTDLPLVRFFAASRRAMHALLVGDTDAAAALLPDIAAHGSAADVADAYAVERSLCAEIARQRHDVETLRVEAQTYEDYGSSQAIPSIHAEAAVLWLAAGEPERAARIVDRIDLAGLPRDVDFVLTVAKTVEAAAALHNDVTARDGAALLEPYAGRAVVNAGAVTFHGVVDHYLWLATGSEDRRAAAAAAYRRVGAGWWLRQLQDGAPDASRAPAVTTVRLLHSDGGWLVGTSNQPVPDVRGLHYLHVLLERPGVEVTASDLVAAAAGHTAVPDSDAGDHLDTTALAAYRQRLRDLDEEIDEATSYGDTGRLERLHDEREALLGEVGRATGLGGRSRRAGDTAERARVSVRKAIAAAFDRIEHHDAVVARLLRRTVRTGTTCAYEPDPDAPVSWQLSP